MKKIVLLILVLFTILSCASVQNVNKLVSNLGLEKCPMCQIKELYINPHEAARLLLDELHTVEIINKRSDEMIKTNPETYHIIWCIRGLQFLTGKVFVADTNEKKVYEIQDFDGKMNPIPFFKDWMSREYIMIAPQDGLPPRDWTLVLE